MSRDDTTKDDSHEYMMPGDAPPLGAFETIGRGLDMLITNEQFVKLAQRALDIVDDRARRTDVHRVR